MLVELAIGDANGAGFEFASPAWVKKHNDGKTYSVRKKHGQVAGKYSDDCQLSVALSMLMVEKDLRDCSTLDWACKVLYAYRRDRRGGYARRFRSVLEAANTGTDLIYFLHPHSRKSGGAMRACPCGLLGTPEEAMDRAVWQASLTHATRDGMAAAAAVALLTWCCRHGVPTKDLAKELNAQVPGYDWLTPWTGPVGNVGIEVARAALTAIQQNNSLTGMLIDSIGFTGDVDTVAAVALGAGSLHPEVVNDLDPGLYAGLENGAYGREYLEKLDVALMEMYPMVP